MDINDMIRIYRDDGNHMLVRSMDNLFYQDPDLMKWRKYFESMGGFSQDPWFAYWDIIIRDLDIKNFLDIGVLGGQFSILVKLLARRYNKNIEVYAVSPFNGRGDVYSVYEQKNYIEVFQQSCEDLNINFNDFNIYKGLSQDKGIQNQLKNIKFQLQYIDGDHTYGGVKQDIEFYVFKLLDHNGIVICDDSEFYVPLGYSQAFRQGHQQVVDAVHDLLDNNSNFDNLFNITHNRIYRRI